MNTTIMIILIAVAATIIPITVSFSMHNRELSPARKRSLWLLTIVGLAALIFTLILYIT